MKVAHVDQGKNINTVTEVNYISEVIFKYFAFLSGVNFLNNPESKYPRFKIFEVMPNRAFSFAIDLFRPINADLLLEYAEAPTAPDSDLTEGILIILPHLFFCI